MRKKRLSLLFILFQFEKTGKGKDQDWFVPFLLTRKENSFSYFKLIVVFFFFIKLYLGLFQQVSRHKTVTQTHIWKSDYACIQHAVSLGIWPSFQDEIWHGLLAGGIGSFNYGINSHPLQVPAGDASIIDYSGSSCSQNCVGEVMNYLLKLISG